MSGPDPLKSAISIENLDDTSLAVPSVNQCRSGAQRVREQVQTIRRTKSRLPSSRSASSSLSPTSPSYEPTGGFSLINGFAKSFSLDKNTNNHQTYNNIKRRTTRRGTTHSSSRYETNHGLVGSKSMGHANTSRSEPGLAWQHPVPRPAVPPQRVVSHRSTFIKQRSSGGSQFMKRSISQPLPNNVQNGLGQFKSQYSTVPNGWNQMITQQPTVPNGSGQFITQQSTVVNGSGQFVTHQPTVRNGSGQFITQQPTVVNGSGQMITQQPTVRNGSGQFKTQYAKVVQNGLSPTKTQLPTVPNGLGQTTSQYIKSSQGSFTKTQSTTVVTDGSTKMKQSGSNETPEATDMTLKKAVELLSMDNDSLQLCGASFIQHNTFISDKAKEEVLKLKGIPLLVNLLHSSEVGLTASASLRNLSYKSDRNKVEIHRSKGIPAAVSQLRDSHSVEFDKQLTGLLWNLSSADNLKSDLLKEALPVLTEHVTVPYTSGPSAEREPEVFLNTTACLRNLSSSKQESRQAMRKQRGLVDSLVSYVKECVDSGQEDDSLENCVCILHNLTYQLENESPSLFNKINDLTSNRPRSESLNNLSPVGCFKPPSKSPAYDCHFDFLVTEDHKPSGAGLLIHSTTLQSYLSLLQSGHGDEMQETCCKIMQNLTSNEGIVSSVMSHMIVQKLKGMKVIGPLLSSNKINLQKSAMALVRNLMRNPNLHSAIGNKALPELMDVLNKGADGANESDDTLAMACQSASTLLLNEPEFNKKYLNPSFIESITDISKNKYLPKSNKAAAILLLTMWSDKTLQSHLKKVGMNKNMFVNETTMAAQKALQAIY
ncbi:plakophilin-1-like [Kryptolebias marmoratus]|uniref:Plakophilin 1b n=1 Tax=Kryptolebias marmoratus TaxID=37003 RepID=A0A3Q3B9V6_KRYMA|nr:plakophilin-1-like [Kryptolebias marmoratus]